MDNQTRSKRHLKYPALTFFMLSHLRACTYSLGKIVMRPWMNVFTILVLAIVLVIPAMFIGVINGITHDVPSWQQTAAINLYLKNNVTPANLKQLKTTLQNNMAINKLQVITPQQGLTTLTQQLQLPDILQQLPNNPLPTVIHITPSHAIDSLQAYQQLTQQLAQNQYVDHAQNAYQWSKQIVTIMHVLTKIAWIVTIVFALAIMIIISTIMRLTLQQEQEEIQVMQFIGAKRSMIMRPLLYQGLWLGILSGMVAMCLMVLLGWAISAPLQQLFALYQMPCHISQFFNSRLLLSVWLLSCVLTWLATLLSLSFKQTSMR